MRPFADEQSLFAAAMNAGSVCPRRIGWRHSAAIHASESNMRRTRPRQRRPRGQSSEQSQMKDADAAILMRMREGHREYEERFGRIFIVCASGKQPAELLRILEHRLNNDPAQELLESAAQQQQIMQLRLRKWLGAA